jgi:hypothetical protein
MNEQRPAQPSAVEILGEAAVDEIKNSLEYGGEFSIGLCSEQRSLSGQESCREELNYKVEALLELIGINPRNWSKPFLACETESYPFDIKAPQLQHAQKEQKGCGQWLYDATIDDHDRQSVTSGLCGVKLIMKVDNRTTLTLESLGNFWDQQGSAWKLDFGADLQRNRKGAAFNMRMLVSS